MEFLRSWVTNITVVIIFIMFLDMVMPNNDMKRFVKVIMGLLIILVIIKPFIMAKDMDDQFQLSMANAAAFIEQTENQQENAAVSAFQNNAALEIYQQKLSDKVKEMVKSHKDIGSRDVQVAVTIENDINKEEFGTIKGVQVFIDKEADNTVEASGIQPVKINAKTVINKKQPEYNLNNSKLSQDLRKDLETALGLKDTEISIEIQE